MAARIFRAISAQKKGRHGSCFRSSAWPQIALGTSPPLPASSGSFMDRKLVHTLATSRVNYDKEFMTMHLRLSQQDFQNELLKEQFKNFQLTVRNDLNRSHSEMLRRNVAFYRVVVGLLFSAYPYFQSKGSEPNPGPCVKQNVSSVEEKQKENQVVESLNPSPTVTKTTTATTEALSTEVNK